MHELHRELPLWSLFLPVLGTLMDQYIRFNHKEANFRLFCRGREEILINSILNNRKALDEYINLRPEFQSALSPLRLFTPAAPLSCLPEIARRMLEASRLTGLGPMASVAGGFAQMALEAAEKEGHTHAVVENGGDICLVTQKELILGIYPGGSRFKNRLAFRVPPGERLAVCSSSGIMGHSLSLGKCDLATVTAGDGFLADSAATLAGNLVKVPEDIQPAVERLLKIPGVLGVLIILGEKIGLGGRLPELVANKDPDLEARITRT